MFVLCLLFIMGYGLVGSWKIITDIYHRGSLKEADYSVEDAVSRVVPAHASKGGDVGRRWRAISGRLSTMRPTHPTQEKPSSGRGMPSRKTWPQLVREDAVVPYDDILCGDWIVPQRSTGIFTEFRYQ